jgi:hypothetical protein
MEQTLTTFANPRVHYMDLAVEMLNGAIFVHGGEVTYDGTVYDMPDETVPIPVREYPTLIFGFLVFVKKDGELALFVDEHIQDGVDMSYEFTRDGPYVLFAYLFRVTVPAGTNDLRALPYDRWRIIPKEQ